MKQRFPRFHGFVAARFSANEVFGLHLTIGLVLLLSAAWVFGQIADDVVRQARITVLDVQLAQYFHAFAGSGWTRFMLVITHTHATIPLLGLAALLGIWFYRRGAHYWLLTLVTAVPGGMILNVLLKLSFQRERPRFDEPLLSLTTYSFPSGHALGATVLYGVLAAYLVYQVDSWGARVGIALGALAMVALVALSRVYLGAHYLSDVLAAVIEGIAWLAICITATATLKRHRAARAGP